MTAYIKGDLNGCCGGAPGGFIALERAITVKHVSAVALGDVGSGCSAQCQRLGGDSKSPPASNPPAVDEQLLFDQQAAASRIPLTPPTIRVSFFAIFPDQVVPAP